MVTVRRMAIAAMMVVGVAPVTAIFVAPRASDASFVPLRSCAAQARAEQHDVEASESKMILLGP
jgi:hypothetical protein